MLFFVSFIIGAVLSLQDAVKIALQNNQTVLYPAASSYRSAILEYLIHKGQYLPQIKISSWSEDNLKRFKGLFTLSERLIPYWGTDLEFNFSTDPLNIRSGGFEIRLSQPFNPQRILNGYFAEKNAKDNVKIAEIQMEIARQDLILQVINNYFGLVRILNSIKRAEESMKSTESILNVMKVKVKGGFLAPMELSNLLFQKNLEMANYDELVESYRTAKEEFSRLLGIELEDSLHLEEDFTFLRFDELSFELCWEVATQNNPELKLFKIQLEQIENNLKIQRFYFFPDVVFSLSYSRSNGDNSQTNPPKKALTIEWPIFSGGILRNRKKLAEESYKLVLFNYEELKYRLRKEIKDLLFRIELAKKKFELYEASRALAKEALEVAEVKYRAGAISYQEWYFNFQRYVDTDESYFNLKTELVMLYARLLRLMGELSLERLVQ